MTYTPETERLIAQHLEQRHLQAELEDQARQINAYPLANMLMEQRFWPMIQCTLHRGVALVSRLFL